MRDVPLVHLHTELVWVSPELGCHGIQRARIVRIGQKRPNRKKCRAYVIDRRPFVLQNVEADRSVLIDVRVKDRRSEDDGRRAVPAQQTVPRRACSLCGLQKKSEREAQILGFRNIPTIILRN